MPDPQIAETTVPSVDLEYFIGVKDMTCCFYPQTNIVLYK